MIAAQHNGQRRVAKPLRRALLEHAIGRKESEQPLQGDRVRPGPPGNLVERDRLVTQLIGYSHLSRHVDRA